MDTWIEGHAVVTHGANRGATKGEPYLVPFESIGTVEPVGDRDDGHAMFWESNREKMLQTWESYEEVKALVAKARAEALQELAQALGAALGPPIQLQKVQPGDLANPHGVEMVPLSHGVQSGRTKSSEPNMANRPKRLALEDLLLIHPRVTTEAGLSRELARKLCDVFNYTSLRTLSSAVPEGIKSTFDEKALENVRKALACCGLHLRGDEEWYRCYKGEVNKEED